MKRAIFFLVLWSGIAWGQPDARQPDARQPNEGEPRIFADPLELRACSRNIITVDVPVEKAIHPSHELASRRVEERLTSVGPSWNDLGELREEMFEPCPPNMEPDIEVTDLMEEIPIERRLGCLPGSCRRHQQIEFLCRRGRWVRPREIASKRGCQVLNGVRSLYRNAGHQDWENLWVSRDCMARPQGWHRPMVGPSDRPPVPVWVAMIDHYNGSPGSHGTQVWEAIETFSRPKPWLLGEFNQFLRDSHQFSIGRVAQALAHLINRLPEIGNEPLVVNMSIGWPAEFSRFWRSADGPGGCTESPAGEAVRYALLHLDERPRTILVAAAGNRVEPVPAHFRGVVGDAGAKTGCGPLAELQYETFFPAGWARVQTCPIWSPATPRRPVLAIGAAGAAGVPGPFTHTDATLFAPGVAVPYQGGTFLTGTSFATGFVTSLAARALAAPGVGKREFLRDRTCNTGMIPFFGAWFPVGDWMIRWNKGGPKCPPGMFIDLPPETHPDHPHAGSHAPVSVGAGSLVPAPASFLADQYHRGAQPQPPDDVCPENNCFGTVATDYATVDFDARLIDSTLDDLSTGFYPHVVDNGTTPPKLKLYKGTAYVTSWTLGNASTMWEKGHTSLVFNNLVIPTSHRNGAEWQDGQYSFTFTATVRESETVYVNHVDSVVLSLP